MLARPDGSGPGSDHLGSEHEVLSPTPLALKVLGVSGSLRPTSKTLMVLNSVMASLEASGLAGRIVELTSLPLPLFSGYSYPTHETRNLEHFRELVATHELILLASPEYHGALSGSLKNALDHLLEGSLQGKVVGLIGVAGGSVSPVGTTTQLRSVVRALGGVASPCELLVTRSKSIFDENRALTDSQLSVRIDSFTAQLLSLSAQLRPPVTASSGL